MRIGDKTKIPYGIRQGESAFIRDIKGNNIWLCLESAPGNNAVLFQLGDFDTKVIMDHIDNITEPKPELYIVGTADGYSTGRSFTDKESAIFDMNRVGKLNPGTKMYLFTPVQEVVYEKSKELVKREIVY